MAYLQLLSSFNRKMGFVSMQRAKGATAIEDMYRKFNVVLDKVVARVHKYVSVGDSVLYNEKGEEEGPTYNFTLKVYCEPDCHHQKLCTTA